MARNRNRARSPSRTPSPQRLETFNKHRAEFRPAIILAVVALFILCEMDFVGWGKFWVAFASWMCLEIPNRGGPDWLSYVAYCGFHVCWALVMWMGGQAMLTEMKRQEEMKGMNGGKGGMKGKGGMDEFELEDL